eukprot:NODE_1493_length_1317_cov_66.413445_g1480_i0.p1 GENE.NODE_1493_length_1317_cov_66.413445_g1480_i0~~NODE_1493_length_1317_cov_66.413445_g1480_i0.p1  ORF type:complete len:345 (+),score=68.55 NODE_1493_length_1317_cov_66.413445_g1480_i0:68-1036(+)
MGTAIALASFNKPSEDVVRINWLVSAVNSGFSLFGGIVIFSVLGYMSGQTGVPVEELASKSGPGLAFVVFAEALTLMPLPQLFSVLFFLMLLSLGLDSTFAWMETINTFILDALAVRGKTVAMWKISLCTAMCTCLCGFLYSTRGGAVWLGLVDHYCATYVLIVVCTVELLVVQWCYGFNRVRQDYNHMVGHPMPRPYKWCWYVAPWCLIVLFISLIAIDIAEPHPEWPPWALALGWLSWLVPVGLIPAFALHYVWRRYHTGTDHRRPQKTGKKYDGMLDDGDAPQAEEVEMEVAVDMPPPIDEPSSDAAEDKAEVRPEDAD